MAAIGIYGGDGRMGRAIASCVEQAGDATVRGIDVGGDPDALARWADVLVDFSAPPALAGHLAAAQAAATPIVVGTTGLDADHHRLIDAAAAGGIAVLQTGNTSLGIALLARLVREAAAALDWDVEIAEMHHRHKRDAPSGTALMLGEAAAAARGEALSRLRVDGRAGADAVREPGSIGFAALRGGSVAGDHRVVLAGDGERIELAHVAEDRSIFAHGAVRAARWLIGRPPGRYRMDDVLGLGSGS